MASSTEEVTLFDLPSKGHCACWSLNPWKTRLVLNLKHIPFKTHWIEYPDIAPTFKSYNILPNPQGTPYTSPTIRLPDGRYIMDSRKIVSELETLHPSPPLHLDAPELKEVETLIPALLGQTRGLILPRVSRDILRPGSIEYFERTLAEQFGMTLAELGKQTDEEAVWAEAEKGLRKFGEMLGRKGGPFFGGEEVGYADLVVVGGLEFFKRVEGRFFERVVRVEPRLGRLYEACGKWLERDDH